MPEQCAIYVRVSSDIQDYERQKIDLKKFAKENDLSIPRNAIFEDKLSGFKDETQREGLRNLMEYVISQNIKKVLVWELSRLARKHLHLLKLAEFFESNQIDVRFWKQGFWLLDEKNKISQHAGMSIALLGWYGEYEAALMKDRFISQKKLNESRGKYNGGFIKFGYKLDKTNHYVVNDDIIEGLEVSESVVIKEVFNLYESGLVCSQICRICRSKNYPAIVCSTHTLARLLRDTSYIGFKNVKLGLRPTPPIISVAQFEIVNSKISENRTKADKGRKHVFLLRGIIKCAVCGSYLVGKQTDDCYICPKNSSSNKTNKNTTCSGENISVSNVDGIIWNQVKRIIYNVDVDGFNDYNSRSQISIKELSDEISRYYVLIEKVEQRKKKINFMFLKGGVSEQDYDKALKEIQKERFKCEQVIKDLEIQKRDNEKLVKDADFLSKRKEAINTLTDRSQIRRIIKSVVKDVTFYRVSRQKTVISLLFNWEQTPITMIYNSAQKQQTDYLQLNPYYIQFSTAEKIFFFRKTPIDEELIAEDGDMQVYTIQDVGYKESRKRQAIFERTVFSLPVYAEFHKHSVKFPSMNKKNSRIVNFDFLIAFANDEEKSFGMVWKVPYNKITYFKDLKWERFHRKKNKNIPTDHLGVEE